MKGWAVLRDANGVATEIAADAACRSKTPADCFLWVHLDGREADATRWLNDHAALPAPVVSALTALETRPRCQPIGEGALINLRGLGTTPEDDPDTLVSIRIWAEQGRVISVGYRTLLGIDRLHQAMVDGTIADPGDLVAALAVEITHRLDPEVAALGDTLDDCEASMAPDKAFAMRRLIANARSEAIGYRRFVSPQREALQQLAALKADWIAEDDRMHLNEAADRFARMAEELESVRERSALLHEELTDLRAEQTETRTLVISIVALIFLPLTFLTGLLGMNVEGIPYAHSPWAFWGVVILSVAVSAAITIYFLRKRWIGR